MQQIFYAANRQHRDDEEKRDELHSLLADEIANSATLAAAHLRCFSLRAPREKVRTDNEEAEKHFGTPFLPATEPEKSATNCDRVSPSSAPAPSAPQNRTGDTTHARLWWPAPSAEIPATADARRSLRSTIY